MTSQGSRPATHAKHAQNIVIDIASSPEPSGPMTSRTTVCLTNAMGKGKSKAKSSKRACKVNRPVGTVIELTDSESDTEPGPSIPKGRNQTNDRAQASPIRHKPFPITIPHRSNSTLVALPAASSLENIPVASGSGSQKKRKVPPTLTPFLPSQSDEENFKPLPIDGLPGKKRKVEKSGMNGVVMDDDWDLEMPQYLLQFYEEDKGARQRLDDPALNPHLPAIPPVLHHEQVMPPDPQPLVAPLTHASPDHIAEPVIGDMQQQKQQDPTNGIIAQILEIIPDVEPDHLHGLVETHLPNFHAQTTEHVLGLLFEDGGYPRAERSKGKRKAVDEGEDEDTQKRPQKKVKVDYAGVERVVDSPVYREFALIHLQISFPYVPKPFLRRILEQNNGLYAPTHIAMAALHKAYAEAADDPDCFLPYIRKSTRYNPAKDIRIHGAHADKDFTEERKWLIDHLQDPNETRIGVVGTPLPDEPEASGKGKGKERATDVEEDLPLEDGNGIECQCCFSEYAFDKMVQCPEAHLFCSSCVSQYAATKLGEHNTSIICMHSSGCALPFTESELRRVLPQKLMSLYERVKQQKEIEEAGLEGLEECPFCEWKCVIEASIEVEKLFRCGNEEGGCGVVSCRSCKKKDHLPKSCKEAEEDKVLDGRHAIEEAMTRALMRNCPKCNKAFVKEAGCNKMTCPHCRTLSCYICRQIITGYQHFDQMPGQPSTSKSTGKCRLWDNVEERHAMEVRTAAEKAAAKYKLDHPDVSDEGIKVDLPSIPPPVAPQPAVPVIRGIGPALPRDRLEAIHAPRPLGALPVLQAGNPVRFQFHEEPLPYILPPPPPRRNPPRREQLQQHLQQAEARMQPLRQQHRQQTEQTLRARAALAQQEALRMQQQQQQQQQQQFIQAHPMQLQRDLRAPNHAFVPVPAIQARRDAEFRMPGQNMYARQIEHQQEVDRTYIGIPQQQVIDPTHINMRQHITQLAHAQLQPAATLHAPVPLVAPGLHQPVHRLYEDALRRHNEERARRR